MINSRQFFVESAKDELPRFERVMSAVPDAKRDYKPHEKSRSAKELLDTIGSESQMFAPIIQKGEIDILAMTQLQFKTAADAAVAFSKALSTAADAAASATDETWDLPARFLAGGKVEWETTRGKMAWGLLLDLIHHRGQLSVYLRPMGVKVPSIYGPSGDENG
jgi:uncharacterized damage-inducible protein DinB